MKFYDFLDKAPTIPKLVVVEGVERIFADRTLVAIIERTLLPHERDLNVDRFVATEMPSFAPISAAIAALPFLGTSRVVIVRGAQALLVQPRRDLLDVANRVPDGNVLVIEDALSPASKRPEPLAKSLGRAALRIDTTPTLDARERFIRETLHALGASADAAAVAALANGNADLGSVRTDLEKLALGGATVTLDDVMRESLVTVDVKAYKFAAAAVAGRAADALALANELFASESKSAAVPLLAALAAEYILVWELARPGGELPTRARWRERELRPVARRIGERRARAGYERAVRGFEAVVTGRADDPRIVVEIATVAAQSAPASRTG